MRLLFVYGSLKRGYEYSDYLREQTFIGEGILSGYQLLCFGDYPAIIKADHEGRQVKGEVYQVSAAALAAIDLLEGDEYKRISVKVEVAGRTECALVYIASNELFRRKSHQRLIGDSWDSALLSPTR